MKRTSIKSVVGRERMRQLYREQRDVLAETLKRRETGRLNVALPDQGMHLVDYLSDGSSDIAIEAAAQRAGRPAQSRLVDVLGS